MVAGTFVKIVQCFACGDNLPETVAIKHENYHDLCLGGHEVNMGTIYTCKACEGEEEEEE